MAEVAAAFDWHELPPRRIALLHLPRMQMRYEFRGGAYSRERSICIENVKRSAGCVVTEISKASSLASR